VIGGLAINAYVEPVVSLDLDIVVFADDIDTLLKMTEDKSIIEKFPHSVDLGSKVVMLFACAWRVVWQKGIPAGAGSFSPPLGRWSFLFT
jgi:hypothetical protein